MAQTILAPSREAKSRRQKTNGFLLPSMVTLASWRFRRTWFLLFMTALGMIAAVVIACAVPLFSDVTGTAGLRQTLRATPFSNEMNLTISPFGLTSRVAHDIYAQVNPIIQQNFAPYMSVPPVFEMNLSSFDIVKPAVTGGTGGYRLQVYGQSMQQVSSHIVLDQGRLPRTVDFTNESQGPQYEIEILLTTDTAASFGVHVGSTMTLGYSFFKSPPTQSDQASFTRNLVGIPVLAHVVGIFHVPSTQLAYWHNHDFTVQTGTENEKTINIFSMLSNADGLLHLFDSVAQQYKISTPFMPFGNFLNWYYHVDPSRVSIAQLNDLTKRGATLRATIDGQYGSQEANAFSYSPDSVPPYPYIASLQLFSPLLPQQADTIAGSNSVSILQQFQTRIQVARVLAFILAAQIIALLLFFTALMTNLLVDRQADAIALLRSRGASRGQIFGALMTQAVGLGILALVAGLPLALLIVLLVSKGILPTALQDATNIFTTNPLQAMIGILGFATAIVLVMLFTMSFSLARAARMDILSARREAARSRRRPLWQRLHLDIVLGVLAVLGYLVLFYLANIGNVLSGTVQTTVSVLFNLLSPYFLVLLFLLIFLRLFPWLLRLASRLATRGRSAASMLALAQMARSPRQAARMTTLLSLALAFAIFSLVLTGTQTQRTQDVAAYQVGADFSAYLPATTNVRTLSGETSQFDAISGVLSASVGYENSGTVGGDVIPLTFDIHAVDTSTFGNTALWPVQASAQSLPSLLATLSHAKSYGLAHNLIPVIVDDSAAHTGALHIGSTLDVTQNSNGGLGQISDINCYVVGIVHHIPGINVFSSNGNNNYNNQVAGMLMDYQTYNTIAEQQSVRAGLGKVSITPNYVWVRTKDDAASLTSVRAGLERITNSLFTLQDRRALIAQLNSDPLTLTLVGILTIGTISTLLLALLGDLLASWLSARTRLTNFVVLRALGTSSRQVASVLLWEQGLIYVLGLLLGLAFGVLLATTVVPTLITYSVGAQVSLPVRTVAPPSLLLILVFLLAIFLVALTMMLRVVIRPSMSQMLRLNED